MVALICRLAGTTILVAGMLVAGSVCGLAGCSRPSSAQTAEAAAPKLALGKVVCLSTHWYPEPKREPDQIENPLLRELVRQAVLIVARDDFGLVTRDETLGESFPGVSEEQSAKPASDEAEKGPAIAPLEVAIDVRSTGTWNAQLFGAGTTHENPLWKQEGTYNFDRPTIYAQLATQIEDLSPKIAESMRSAGATGEAKKLNPENKPGPDVEKRLGEMNFVSQYAAVRAAHQAIAEKGASVEWLGVLVRGYANLSMLTDHLWSSQNDAFAARSLLYAERMIQLSDNKPLAKWHRAYARSIIGMDVPALEEAESLLASDDLSTAAKTGPDIPAWTKLVVPYVKFEHDALEKVAKDSPGLQEIVTVLQWNLYRSYYHDRWIYEKGYQSIRTCREAYGVYSAWANWPALALQRNGAAWGIAAFDRFLPPRVLTLPDLPKGVQDAATAPQDEVETKEDIAKRPGRISQALAKAGTEENSTDCSWAILGQLIAEQQFVLAADIIAAEQDATEHSQDAVINHLMELVGDHPCAAYISSYSDQAREKNEVAKQFGELKIRDPNGNMAGLFIRGWNVPVGDGMKGRELAWSALWGADLTYPGRCRSLYNLVIQPQRWINVESMEKLADAVRALNPNAPQAVRLMWELQTQSDATKFAEYEKALKEDPRGWYLLGWIYYSNNDYASAKRCYEHSVKISPTFAAIKGLADCYVWEGNKKLARETLEGYGKLDDLGLEHFHIAEEIAEASILERNWPEAEKSALAAAGAYSGSGLMLASRVYEGLRNAKKAEYFAGECSRSYPSYTTGTEWYFCCRRIGGGDKDAARSIAEQSIKRADTDPSWYEGQRACTYYLLEGDAKNALRRLDFSKCPHEEPMAAVWRLAMTAVVAGELKDKERRTQSIAELREMETKFKEIDAPSADLLEQLCRAFEGAKFKDEELQKIETNIERWQDSGRNYLQFVLGCALDDGGDKENGELFWRRAAFRDPFNSEPATLAGDKLVKRYGTERGGLPKEYAEQEAKVAKEKSDGEVAGSAKVEKEGEAGKALGN
jgi:tetratricopeptide (TPR) repeat protein